MSKQKILMIVNEFPPTGESGVQRPLKFVKYLVRAGWDVFVITPRRPTKTVLDYSMEKEIPAEAHIIKTASWGLPGKGTTTVQNLRYAINGKPFLLKQLIWKVIKHINDFVFPIDKQIGWVPFAYSAAKKVIKKHSIKNVYITGFPFSAFFIGVWLKRRFKDSIFWLADYRDAWQFEPKFEEQVNAFRQNAIRRVEARVLKSADYFSYATQFITQQYQAAFPEIVSRSITITNGYDEDDFTSIQSFIFSRFTVLYMGKIYAFKGSPIPLMNAMKKLKAERGTQDFSFTHIGTVPQEILDYVKNNRIDFYEYLGYKSHDEALAYAAGADVLVIIVNNDPESKGVLTGKIFELARLGRPILALGPRDSLLEQFIKENNCGEFAFCEDEQEIYEAMKRLFAGNVGHAVDDTSIQQYSRENLTKKLMECYR
jgi:glycosyltransferase involved in cell wall biosynthesis